MDAFKPFLVIGLKNYQEYQARAVSSSDMLLCFLSLFLGANRNLCVTTVPPTAEEFGMLGF